MYLKLYNSTIVQTSFLFHTRIAVIQIKVFVVIRVNDEIISIFYILFWVARKKVTQKAVAIIIF